MGDLYSKCVIAFCIRSLLKNTSSQSVKFKTNAIQNILRKKAQKCVEMITSSKNVSFNTLFVFKSAKRALGYAFNLFLLKLLKTMLILKQSP